MFRTISAAVVVGTLTACSLDPKFYESPPVTIPSPLGPVVCQLYTKDIVEWDRAMSRPPQMSVAAADAICLAEGQRQKG